jgi:hypothetical protein
MNEKEGQTNGGRKIEGWKDIWRNKMEDEMRKRGWQMEGEREKAEERKIER